MIIMAMTEIVQMIDVSTNMSPIVCSNPDIGEHSVIYFTCTRRGKGSRMGKAFLQIREEGKNIIVVP